MTRTCRSFLLIALTATTALAHAQSWCAPGAEWTFDFISDVAQQSGVVRVEYDGDSLIDGSTVQRLRQWAHVTETGQSGYNTWSWGNLFTRSTDDLVELYDPVNEAFDTLMWFAAQPSQHWSRAVFGGPNQQVITVEETSTIVVDGVSLRQLVVSGTPDFWSGTDTLIERVGYLMLYPRFEQSLGLEGGAWNLRCYRDDELSYSTVTVSGCGFTVGIGTTEPAPVLTPFPNPGTDHFSISLSSGAHIITLFDALGQQMMQLRSSSAQCVVGTQQLAPGIYTSRVDDGSVPIRWVKE